MTLGGIDHVVWEARDLEAARARFRDLGFTLTPPAVHPFGTGNSLAQFSSSFIELLSVVTVERIVPHAPEVFSFSALAAAFLEKREGISMLVLASDDARADNAAWRERGLSTYEVVDFERKAKLPDGSEARVAFSIAFAIDPAMPEIAFFICQQHAPEFFWKPDYQRHDNTALEIARITLVAETPLRHRGFFEKVIGTDAVLAEGEGLRATTARGTIAVLSSAEAREAFPEGVLPPALPGAGFAAVHLASADLVRCRVVLEAAGIEFITEPERMLVPASAAFGAALVFESAAVAG
jgi:hypothetical protein